jgi:hypothetical protein
LGTEGRKCSGKIQSSRTDGHGRVAEEEEPEAGSMEEPEARWARRARAHQNLAAARTKRESSISSCGAEAGGARGRGWSAVAHAMVGRGPAEGPPAASRGRQLDAQQEPQIWTGENIAVGLADTMLERENDCSIRIRVNYTYIYRQEVGPLLTHRAQPG